MHGQQNATTTTIMQEVLLNGNIPVAGPGRTGMMSGSGGLIPPALLEESRVPRFYQEAIVACGAANSTALPNTALVYNMMVTSGLPRPVLSYVWSAVNRTLPGQLTRAEFYSCLALIALSQKGESLAALSTLSQLPIPYLQPAVQVPVQQPPVVIVNQQQQQPTAPVRKQEKSSFIPLSLLRRKQPVETTPKGDLLGEPMKQTTTAAKTPSPPFGDLIQPTTSSSSSATDTTSSASTNATSSSSGTTAAEIPPSGPNYDLTDIDWGNVGSSFETESNSLSAAPPPSSAASSERKVSNGESASAIWSDTLKAASSLFKECDALLADSSDVVLREIFETERGIQYLKNLYSLSVVVGRVRQAAGGREKELDKEISYCEGVWKRFGRFLEEAEKDSTEEEGISNAVCPVCRTGICSGVEFAGRSYHSECANLWVNCVRPVLP